MRVTIAAIGRERDPATRALFDRYVERLPWKLTLHEAEAKKAKEGPARMAEEAALLSKAMPAGATLVALDERGRDLDSPAFAKKIGAWIDGGIGDVAFVIGGADGLHPDLRSKASLTLCFGKLTWPHLLVRVMLAEQLYRASTILAGHPYHRA